ncbi:unnamed protein product [Nesidiocoris tenuis]|uniref:Tr-type G domain-containing protein n=1 Tax=Nesidiocoris tenuis TaxID=355587 RepID=A0A6H5GRH2_9HEMI|nr:unnamed protein product [Nesidiocoris tenuis]
MHLKAIRLCKRCILQGWRNTRRCSTGSKIAEKQDRIRNIGIMAHVDAGKTTTTERLLFYSGEIPTKGEVHHGNTVTDYLTQERDRGISIVSAFVQFKWKDHVLNLVDTPGHIDFSAEVENALGVIDSAILLLDSSAGVEAQTLTVWRQIQKHELPCLVYINKMDRLDADVAMCLDSLKSKLHCVPLTVQIPTFEKNDSFNGIVDLPSLDHYTWNVASKRKDFTKTTLKEDDELFAEAMDGRNEMVDKLSSLDDEIANIILEKGSLESVSQSEILKSVRRVAIAEKGVPVICGSSYKDIGVQPLLDAIVNFLPSPNQTKLAPNAFKNTDLLLKSFKVEHDRQRGPVTFLRVYSGQVSKGQKVYNANKCANEQIGKVLVPFADDLEEIPSGVAGQYVAVTGLKVTHPGEVICNSESALKRIKSQLVSTTKMTESSVDKLLNLGKREQHPVFFCSVEASSQMYQQALEKALAELVREDAGLGVTQNDETGQTILSGMGELHLEIIRDRLRTAYKLDVDVGSVQIMYKEQILEKERSSYTLKNVINSKQLMVLDTSGEAASNLAHVLPKHLSAVERGLEAALSRGPILGYQVINSQATLHWLECKRSVPDQLLSAAASHCVAQILKQAQMILLEPIMAVDIAVPKDKSPPVIADLSRRRADILNIEERSDNKLIRCEVPTAELVGYATTLRTITSGTASLLMTFTNYRTMTDAQVQELKDYSFNYKKFG